MADDREINTVTAFPSAARTASANGADQSNRFHKGLILTIDCTAIGAAPSVVFTLQGKDELSGKYYTILASAAITATGTTKLVIFPGSTVTANLAANHPLPKTWRVITTASNSDSMTASVGAITIP